MNKKELFNKLIDLLDEFDPYTKPDIYADDLRKQFNDSNGIYEILDQVIDLVRGAL